MALAPGTTLGPYEIVSLLGEGGMGAVYKARDPRLDRFVAIKVLTADSAGSEERQQRFAQEARAASALNHPNIVTVHDTGTEGDTTYIAMELVSGKTLANLIPSHGLPIPQVLGWATQIADGLARAHKAGLVHRDLKPGNVMVDEDGRVRILDFGLAKATGGAPRGGAESSRGADLPTATSPPLTDEGIVMGTVAYMSPEQAEGQPVDARSDIFSFGVLLYEMLAGRRPFDGDSRMGTISSILRDTPAALSQSVPGLPGELERLIDRCLRKGPDRRWQHMSDLRNALLDLKEDSDSGRLSVPASSADASAARSVNRLWLAAAVPVVLLVGWLVFGRSPQEGASSPEPTPVPLTAYPGDERDPTFSPDGNQVAFTWDQGDALPNLWLKLLGPSDPIRLTTSSTERHVMAQWSPDGQWIAFTAINAGTSRRRIMVIPALGQAAPRPIGEGTLATWTPDSRGLVFSEREGLFIHPLEGGERRLIIGRDGGVVPSRAIISPDGRWLAFTNDGWLSLVRLDTEYQVTGPPSPLVPADWATGGTMAWTPDSTEIVFIRSLQAASANLGGETAMYRVGIDGSAPRRIASVGANPWFLDVAQQGDRLAFTRLRRDVNLYVVELGDDAHLTGEEHALAPSSLLEDSPSLSRDGGVAAFTSNRDGSLQIYAVRRDGTGLIRLTQFDVDAVPGAPRPSPDGAQVAFRAVSPTTGQSEVFVVPAMGGEARAVTSSGGTSPSWSADGRWIYYSWQGAIMRVPVEGGDPVQVTDRPGTRPVESHDGRWLYFGCDHGSSRGVCRMPATGGDVTQLLDQPLDSLVDLDVTDRGVYLLTLSQETGAETADGELWRLPLDGGRPVSLGILRGATLNGFSVGRDDREVLYARCDLCDADLMLINGFR